MYKEYKLWENGTPGYNPEYGQAEPAVTFYPADNGAGRGCVIICPGGGYSHLAPHEGEPIAKMLNLSGINAFVLRYRLAPYAHPCILNDAQRAIRLARSKAKFFNINPNKIGILGFSAGGHLAASAATLYDLGREDGDNIDRTNCRPDAAVMCYAVTNVINSYGHRGLGIRLNGGNDFDDELGRVFSPNRCVDENTPPCFFWHTSEDSVVDVRNAYMMAVELREHNVKHELHVFPDGRHGLGLNETDPHCARWSELCREWLVGLGF